MGLFKRKKRDAAPEKKSNEPVLAAVITNTVSSEIYQDMLKENGIRFVCRQHGADGYLKLVFGPATVPDYIYVSEENYERARELYEIYVEADGQVEILDSEEE